ncbi:Cu-processing system ATP-binding protein [Halospina denitrificans]|uniref:Cu-processing system ATP-binding protein n=1 Tax=Halospina denitrificans TaxID=332522 RepID=A0A4R7JSC9_9GAMM|nr:ABC transporter ATP-binding protein [Halospina denitrificans]TDT40173.1 Cu-processing system ATP-binding protein [Halospina denitrificans]
MTNAVDLEQLSCHFGNVKALNQLDLALPQGEILGLLGHNGAGKSTAMKLILGILSPSSGQVRVFGEDPRGPDSGRLRFQLGYLPENVSFYDNLSGREVLAYFARLKRVSPGEVDRLLTRVGLDHAARRRVRTYSKGMRQRLGLAQALLGEPRLLLLDEPTAGLDPMATRDVYSTIDELRARGTAVIVSSHVLPGIEKHVDRVAILGRGRLLAEGTIEALRSHAELPLTIRIRQSDWAQRPGADLHPAIQDVITETDNSLAIRVRTEDKLPVLNKLLSLPGLEDVTVEPPTLESLYAHFDTQLNSEEAQHA